MPIARSKPALVFSLTVIALLLMLTGCLSPKKSVILLPLPVKAHEQSTKISTVYVFTDEQLSSRVPEFDKAFKLKLKEKFAARNIRTYYVLNTSLELDSAETRRISKRISADVKKYNASHLLTVDLKSITNNTYAEIEIYFHDTATKKLLHKAFLYLNYGGYAGSILADEVVSRYFNQLEARKLF